MNEHKNTMRALTDEPLLGTSIWCRVGWHNWTKFNEPTQMRDSIYTVYYQGRKCEHCGVGNIKILTKVSS